VCPDRLKWYAEAEKTNGRWVRAAKQRQHQHFLFSPSLGLGAGALSSAPRAARR
jgi:hypothetical protein